MEKTLFDDWIAKSNIAPDVAQALKPVMEGFDKSDMFLNLAIKGSWPALRMVKSLKSQLLSQGVDFSAIDSLVPSASASAAVPLPVALPASGHPATVQVDSTQAVAVSPASPTPDPAVNPTPDPAAATSTAPAIKVIKPMKAPTPPPSATPATPAASSQPQATSGKAPKGSGKKGVDWAGVLSKIGFGKKPGGSAAATATPAAATPAAAGPAKNKKTMIFIIAGSVIAVVLLVAAYMMFGGSSSGQAYANPNAESVFGDGTSPNNNGTVQIPTSTVQNPDGTVQTPATGTDKEWFIPKNLGASTEEPFLNKPETFIGFFTNFPWRWFLWAFLLIPLLSLLAQDRMAASEKTDLKTVNIGLTVLVVSIFLAQPISMMIQWGATQVGIVAVVEPWVVTLLGIGINISLQYAATTSGKLDYSALAVAGLFVTGALLVWWGPKVVFQVVVGIGMMIGGMALEAIEMSRTHQGYRAIWISFIMIGFFALGFAFYNTIAYFLSLVPAPATMTAMTKTGGLFLYTLIKSKYFIGCLIGLVSSWTIGDWVSAKIMPPVSNAGTVTGVQDPTTVKLDVTSRFDAMSFALMLMYPISYVVFYLAILFGKF